MSRPGTEPGGRADRIGDDVDRHLELAEQDVLRGEVGDLGPRERAFVIEAAETESTFGVTATPWQDALAATLTAMGVVPAAASSRV